MKTRRPAVRITDDQRKRYVELIGSGVIRAKAIRTVQSEFNMPTPHNRQAVEQVLKLENITPVKGTRQMSSDNGISLDQATELIIEAFNARKRLPMIEAELEKYKRGYENIMEAARAKDEADKKHRDQEQRFKVAQQQGDFTEHI